MEKNLKTLLTKYGFSFKKAYGQNFLTDESLLDEIVIKSGVRKDDTVLEIGCGAGALTKALCKKAKRVVGYEIDTRLKPLLSEVLEDYSNAEIVFKDVMKESLDKIEKDLPEGYIMVANLPYYITTPCILKFLENSEKIKAMVIMVQEEVAKRLSSNPSSPDYGAITVAVDLRGKGEIIKTVKREMFTPVPNVDSAVVKISIDREKNKGVDFSDVREAVKIAFSSRRKMLVNNLMNGYKIPRVKAEEVLSATGISLTARGETLSSEEFIKLSKVISEKIK